MEWLLRRHLRRNDLLELADHVARVAVQEHGAAGVEIHALLPYEGTWTLIASRFREGTALEAEAAPRGPAALAVELGVTVDSSYEDEDRFDPPVEVRRAQMQRGVALPILGEDRPRGVVLLHFRDPGHTPLESMGAVKNTVELLAVGIERRVARERLSLLSTGIEQSPDSLLIANADGRIVFVNETFERNTDWSRSELIGLTVDVFATGVSEEQNYATLFLSAVVKGNVDTVLMNSRRDGTVYFEEVRVNAVRRGGVISHMVFRGRDITRQVQIEERYRLSERTLRDVRSKMPLGIVELDSEGRLTEVNEALEPLFGSLGGERGAAVPRYDQLSFFADEHHRAIRNLLAGRHESLPLFAVPDPETGQRLFRGEGVPQFDSAGNVESALLLLIDVTDSEELRTRRNRPQKMDNIGQLASGIAHDFNNLLTAILGSAELGLMQSEELKPQHDMFSNIVRASLRGSELVRKLLNFSRENRAVGDSCPMLETVRDTLDLFERTVDPRIHLVRGLSGAEQRVQMDASSLQQIVMNLLVNARDALNGQGTIEVAIGEKTLDGTEAQGFEHGHPGDFIVLRVRDDGPGMPDHVQARIFEPFFTTKSADRGTGLGLAMVFSILKAGGGFLDVQSRPGEGTRFDIYLKRAESPEPDDNRIAGGTRVKLVSHSRRVMVIEDDPEVRAPLASMLESLNCEVIEASSGHAGLQQYDARRGEVDLVILNAFMPHLSGAETLERLRARNPELPVLIATGFNTSGPGADLLRRGANGILRRPFRLHELSEALVNLAPRPVGKTETPRHMSA